MDSSFAQLWSWAFGIACAALMPWLLVTSTRWIIFRAGEERLRALPFSIWQPLYRALFTLSQETLVKLASQLTDGTLYQAFNPERCRQQTLKVLVPYTEALTDQLVRPLSPVIWDNLPLAVRLPIYQRVSNRFRPCVDQLISNFEIMLSQVINHQQLIGDQLQKQETGYRFIPTEALHHHWHGVKSRSQVLSFFSIIPYLALGSLWPAVSSNLVLPLIPLGITTLVSWKSTPLNTNNKKAFARCLGYWFGERLYLLDDVVRHMATSHCDQIKVRRLITRSFRALTEDAALRTLAQVALGRRALLELRSGLVSYVLHNGSIPFEHSQFKQERALEVSAVFTHCIELMNTSELCDSVNPIMRLIQRLLVAVALGLGIVSLAMVWYITRM